MEEARGKALQNEEAGLLENPFNMLPRVMQRISSLERTYVTSLGFSMEKFAVEFAKKNLGPSEHNKSIIGKINIERIRRISDVINDIERGVRRPNLNEELEYILAGKNEKYKEIRVICDVYIKNRITGLIEAHECKSPCANNDQCKAARKRILELLSMEPPQVDNAFFSLVHNPYGNLRKDYSWSFVLKWFGVHHNDPSILIGEEFWDRVGGVGMYLVMVKAAEEVSNEYEDILNREFMTIGNILVGTDSVESTLSIDNLFDGRREV
jgi:hypothetical protein